MKTTCDKYGNGQQKSSRRADTQYGWRSRRSSVKESLCAGLRWLLWSMVVLLEFIARWRSNGLTAPERLLQELCAACLYALKTYTERTDFVCLFFCFFFF